MTLFLGIAPSYILNLTLFMHSSVGPYALNIPYSERHAWDSIYSLVAVSTIQLHLTIGNESVFSERLYPN
jgi:hypothetical protein